MSDRDSTARARDEQLMERALALAERGRGTTRPNPMVGCVIVRDGTVVGEGWHERAGGPHAEVEALTKAGDAAAGATVYVTLEPCAHAGRTAPCTDALVAAGVARVVYAVDDPDPVAAGGAEILRRGGVAVDSGLLAEEARKQNEVFFHVHETGRAHVTLKIAQTLDGRVAARDGSSRWVTSPEARRAVHHMRAEVDGVAVGSGTVLADDPELSAREVETPAGQPRPVVFDARGRTPPTARAVRPDAIVLTTAAAPDTWRRALEGAGVEVLAVSPASDGGVDLDDSLAALAARGVHAVLVEGGPTLTGSLVRGGHVDRLVIHLAPSVLGGDGLAAVAGAGAASVEDRWRWEVTDVTRRGPDVEIVARRREE